MERTSKKGEGQTFQNVSHLGRHPSIPLTIFTLIQATPYSVRHTLITRRTSVENPELVPGWLDSWFDPKGIAEPSDVHWRIARAKPNRIQFTVP